MTPGHDRGFDPEVAIVQVVDDFESLSVTLQSAINGLKRQPGSEETIASLERALARAQAGVEVARKLETRRRESRT
jgi:hypothetical protein